METLCSFAVVEFPGFLRNPDDPRHAIAALGGEDAVRSITRLTFGDDSRRLSLNLRLGMGSSPSNIASEELSPKSNLFVLTVSTNLGADVTNNTSGDQGKHLSPFKPRVPSVSRVTLGQATSITSFHSIADYQFHPRKLIQTARKSTASTPHHLFKRPSEVASEALFPVAKQLCREPREDDIDYLIDRLRPTRFLRCSLEYGDTEFWYRQFRANFEGSHANPQTSRPANRALIEDRRSDAKRLEGLFHRVKLDVDQVPVCPHPSNNLPLVRGRNSAATLQALIDKLFKIRPIWIRRALLEGIPMNLRSSFKRVIVNAGYCFQGPGPFYLAWIRYGYDPRKDPSARKYQVFQVRINHPVIIEAAELQRQEKGTVNDELHHHNNLESHSRDDFKADKSEQEFKLPSAYQLSPDLPLRKNNFAQLCDIKLPEVEEFCRRTQPEEAFDNRFGFFTESSQNELIVTIRRSLVRIGTEVVGEHRLPYLLKHYKKYPNEEKRQRRKRICLKSVIHPTASPDTHQEPEINPARTELDSAQSRHMPAFGTPLQDNARIEIHKPRVSDNVLRGKPSEAEHAVSDEPTAGRRRNLPDLVNLNDVQSFDIFGADDEDDDDSENFADESGDKVQVSEDDVARNDGSDDLDEAEAINGTT